MNAIKENWDKLSVDQKMWAGIGAFCLVMVVLFSLFTTGGAVVVTKKLIIGILEMFVPGYVVVKLFLADFQVTENRALDRFILSLGISIVLVQTLAFVAEYITVFGLNEDQDERISRENYKAPIIALLVIGGAFAAKYLPPYLRERKKNQG